MDYSDTHNSTTLKDPRLFTASCADLIPIETLHENPWFTVRKRGDYFTFEQNHIHIIVLPIVDNNAILLVRVNRPLINAITFELPAGAVEPGESPVEGAAREFMEETGIKVDNLSRFKPLLPLSNMPNRDPILTHIFQIELTKEEYLSRKDHDQEIIEVKKNDFSTVKRMIIEGKIYIGLSVAVIGRFFLEKIS